MAPTLLSHLSVPNLLKTVHHLSSRSASTIKIPLVSIFAVIVREATTGLKSRAVDDLYTRSQLDSPFTLSITSLSKRQTQQTVRILAIPTTYAGLNSGPAPGEIVGIVLGSVAGFILLLYALLGVIRSGWQPFQSRTIIEEEEIVHHRRRSRARSQSQSAMSEVRSPPRRQRSETVVIEREEEVVVEEEHSDEEDIVEVIEEHSPERRPGRRKPSGFRTVDPSQFGGGGAPLRKVSRR